MINKMNKVQDIASLQADNRSLLQQLETMTIRHNAALQQNQELRSQNEYLFSSIKNHLEDDWNQHKHDEEHIKFNGEHVSTLQRVREQLTQSLNALEKPTVFQTLKQYDSQQSFTPKHSASLEEDYDALLSISKRLDSKPPALWQEFKDKLQQYHRKVVELAEQLHFQKSKMERYENHRMSLEDALNDAKQANKNIYHQLLQVSEQLQNAQKIQSQASSIEEQREKLTLIIHKYQQQNKLLKEHLKSVPVQREDLEQRDFQELRKCYKQIAALKLKIQQTQESSKDSQDLFETDRAQLELAHLLTKKKLEENEKTVMELKKQLNQLPNVQNQTNRMKQIQQYKEEIYLLKIKVFALESLQIGNKYKISRNQYFQDFTEKMKPYLQLCDNWKLEALQLMAENHSIIKQLEKKLEEEEAETERIRKKYYNSKEKYNALTKSKLQSQAEVREGYKAKNKEYQYLIQRMQTQMEKMQTINNDTEVQQMTQKLILPLQQQLDIISTQNASLKNQLIIKEQFMVDQSYKYQTEIKGLKEEIDKLKHDNISLQRANRQSQSMLLQHNLNLKVYKVQGNTNKSQGKKSSIQSEEKSQINRLEQEITLLRSRLQEQYDLFSKQTLKNQKLNSLTKNQAKQLQELRSEVKQQKNKQKESIISNQSPLIFSQTQVPRINSFKQEKKVEQDESSSLKITIADLKRQLSKQRQFGSLMTERAQKDVDQALAYKKRIEELEVTLNSINEEKEKALEQIQYLLKKQQKHEQQMELMKGNSNSLKKIEWIQHNNELQTQLQLLKINFQKKNEELEQLKRQLQNSTKQNDFFCQQIVKLKNIIKDNKLQHDQKTVGTEAIEKEMDSRVEQLYKKIKDLNQDKEVLTTLVQELRNKSISARSINSLQGNSDSLDQTYLKNSLLKAQKEAKTYKQELTKIKEERDGEAQKLKNELQAVNRELEFYKKGGIKPFVGKGSISSRGVSEKEHSELADDFYHDGAIVKSEVIDPMKEIELKNIIIRQLKEELQTLKQQNFIRDPYERKASSEHDQHQQPTYGNVNKFRSFQVLRVPQTIVPKKEETRDIAVGPDIQEEDRSDVYLKQLYQLRNETQQLRQSNLMNQKKIRSLEEQNSSLRFKLLSGTSNLSSQFKTAKKPEEYKPVLPLLKPLEPYSLHSSNFSNPDSSIGYEDKLSSHSGMRSNSSMPVEFQNKQAHPKSKFHHEDKVIEYESETPNYLRNFKKVEKEDMDALAPLVQSIQGLGNL